MTTRPTTPVAPRWTTIVLYLIAVPNLLTGLWAVIAPRSWFDEFPGFAPRLVAAYPPYNEHLVSDAGAGLLAVGVLATAAALTARRDAHLVAGAGLLAFTGPHATFHLLQPSEALSSVENAVSTGSLVVTALGSLLVLARAATTPVDQLSHRIVDGEATQFSEHDSEAVR